MPTQCSAIGCSNRFDTESKQRGISFHKVPLNPERREAWKRALRRDFVITKHTVICSAHFEEKDLDRTGQTNRLRDGVTPSIFNFPNQEPDPDQPRRSKRSRRKTKKGEVYKSAIKKKKFIRKIFLPDEEVSPRTGVQKARKSIRGSGRRSVKDNVAETALPAAEPPPPPPPAAPPAAPTPNPSADDHHYAIDPDNVKQKLEEAHARIEELQKELRNYKDRLRRKDSELQTLMVDIEKQNALMGQLMEGSELWVLCDKCSNKD